MAAESELVGSFLEHSLIDLTPAGDSSSTTSATLSIARPQTPPPRSSMFDVLLYSPVSEDGLNATLAPAVDLHFDDDFSIVNPRTVSAALLSPFTPSTLTPVAVDSATETCYTVNPKSLSSHSSILSLASTSLQFQEMNITDDDNTSSCSLDNDTDDASVVPRRFDWKVDTELNDAIDAWIKKNDDIKRRQKQKQEAKARALAAAIAAEEERFLAIAAQAEASAKAKAREEALKKLEAEKKAAFERAPPTKSIPTAVRSNSLGGVPTASSAARSAQLKRRKSESSIQTISRSSAGNSSSKNRRRSSSMPTSSPRKPSSKPRAPCRRYTEAQKPFKCSKCDNSFRRQEHLKRHYRSLHSNERPYECQSCEKKFSRSDNLAQHTKTHHFNDVVVTKRTR